MAFDAILIPGGGVRAGGALPSWVQRRLERAVEIYAGETIVTLSAGTTHRPPPLDAEGFPILESVAAAQYLRERGIPPERLITETISYDTVGNAFFSRILHVDIRGWQKLLVIASDFHLPRVEALFNWVYRLTPAHGSYELQYECVADPEMDAGVLEARQQQEQRRLETIRPITDKIKNLREFHHWLFTEHEAYNSTRSAFGRGRVPAAALESY